VTARPRAVGALIIGDEILTGKRSDKHLAHVIATLGARGITLDYAQYLGDDRERLTAVLRETLARDDVVFSFGGIGATPDDHTRQACAAASACRSRGPRTRCARSRRASARTRIRIAC
jgi:molybdopterin-biosynthesis enzyme MoeA-like protein